MTVLNCNSCGHGWNYSGGLTDYTTCPNCGHSVKIPSADSSNFKAEDVEEEMGSFEERLDRLEETLTKVQDDLITIEEKISDRDKASSKTETDEKSNEGGLSPYDPTMEFEF
ncbi:hypothetical protein ACEU6E_09145 [Halorutilales archaeon Cl-col2-1]